jgi:hypothetical protein
MESIGLLMDKVTTQEKEIKEYKAIVLQLHDALYRTGQDNKALRERVAELERGE